MTISDSFTDNSFKTIDLNRLRDINLALYYKDDIEEDRKVFNNLIQSAIKNISKAKKYHDAMEEYYIPNINFAQVNKVKDDIVQRILKYDNK